MTRRDAPHLTTAATWALAGATAFIMSCSWLLDGPGDVQAAQDVADEAATAEYAAALADGGAAKCAVHGGVPLWTSEGDLVCRAGKSVVAQGGQP